MIVSYIYVGSLLCFSYVLGHWLGVDVVMHCNFFPFKIMENMLLVSIFMQNV